MEEFRTDMMTVFYIRGREDLLNAQLEEIVLNEGWITDLGLMALEAAEIYEKIYNQEVPDPWPMLFGAKEFLSPAEAEHQQAIEDELQQIIREAKNKTA
jgi:hypothetical protein